MVYDLNFIYDRRKKGKIRFGGGIEEKWIWDFIFK